MLKLKQQIIVSLVLFISLAMIASAKAGERTGVLKEINTKDFTLKIDNRTYKYPRHDEFSPYDKEFRPISVNELKDYVGEKVYFATKKTQGLTDRVATTKIFRIGLNSISERKSSKKGKK